MRRFFNAVAVSLLLLGAACATSPGAPAQAGQGTSCSGTFNNSAACVERGVLVVQATATSLLRARTITLEQDQLIQKQVDLVHTGVVLAKSLQSSNPAQAAIQLTSAAEQLGALKKQTGVSP